MNKRDVKEFLTTVLDVDTIELEGKSLKELRRFKKKILGQKTRTRRSWE